MWNMSHYFQSLVCLRWFTKYAFKSSILLSVHLGSLKLLRWKNRSLFPCVTFCFQCTLIWGYLNLGITLLWRHLPWYLLENNKKREGLKDKSPEFNRMSEERSLHCVHHAGSHPLSEKGWKVYFHALREGFCRGFCHSPLLSSYRTRMFQTRWELTEKQILMSTL